MVFFQGGEIPEVACSLNSVPRSSVRSLSKGSVRPDDKHRCAKPVDCGPPPPLRSPPIRELCSPLNSEVRGGPCFYSEASARDLRRL